MAFCYFATTAAAFLWSNPVSATSVGIGGIGGMVGEEAVPAGKILLRWQLSSSDHFDWLRLGFGLHLAYGRWQHPEDSTQLGANNTLEFAPMFRFQHLEYPRYFFDTSVGLAVFSRSKFGDKKYGTNFQFSDFAALGLYFDAAHRWEGAFCYQHYSNNGNTPINDGMDFWGTSILYHY